MPHVLIVDDDVTSTRLLADLFSAHGFAASTAMSTSSPAAHHSGSGT